MAAPPRAAQALLWLCLPEQEWQTIPGDLEEEYLTTVLPRLGERGARWWYLRQAVHSAGPLLAMRCRQGALSRLLVFPLLVCVLPIAGFESAWSLLLTQIPLKADSLRGADYALISLALGLLGGFCGGFTMRAQREAASRDCAQLALLSLLFTPCVVLPFADRSPIWFPVCHVVLVPAGILLGGALAGWRSKLQRSE
ncbi:hypothetical protein [Paludibaculum fermentans]|uniref:hypothetical protein n=1 Tax=Paludibaculum fermentans TaxID=1473598 RepID=UPI003EBC0C49